MSTRNPVVDASLFAREEMARLSLEERLKLLEKINSSLPRVPLESAVLDQLARIEKKIDFLMTKFMKGDGGDDGSDDLIEVDVDHRLVPYDDDFVPAPDS